MARPQEGAWPYTLTVERAATRTRARSAADSWPGAGTSTIRVEGRSPSTGGKPLRSTNVRNRE